MAAATPPIPRTQAARRWNIAARAAWVVVAVVVLNLFALGLPLRYAQVSTLPPATLAGLTPLGLSAHGYALLLLGLEGLVVGGFALTAMVLFWYRSDEPMVLFVALMLLLLGVMNGIFVRSPWALAALHPALALICRGLACAAYTLLVLFFFLFPDGRFTPMWTAALALPLVAWVFAWVFAPQPDFLTVAWGPLLLQPVTIPLLGCLVGLQVYRYLRVSDEAQRQQTRWVVFGVAGSIIGFLEAIFVGKGVDDAIARPFPDVYHVIGSLFASLAVLLIPVAFGVAVTRHRLFAIDLFVNRALVYGALTTGVIAGYALLVGLLSQIFQTSGNFLISLLATGIVAVIFQPLRARLQRTVNRLLYGDRDEPYSVISRLGQRLEATLDPGTVLPTIVETVATALKLPYAAIQSVERRTPGGAADTEPHILAEYPDRGAQDAPADAVRRNPPHGARYAIPLLYQGEEVGQLLLAPRPGEARFSAHDQRVLEDLARQAGIAVHAVRLTADLRRSRERVVSTREEERRRLRRDLHDGLGPTLAGIAQRIGLAATLMPRNPEQSLMLLHQLEDQVRATIADVRRLVYDLRPPILDQYGLLGAIREEGAHIAGSALKVNIEAPERLPPLPAAVEVAAYRIVMEALANVVHHAEAGHCVIRVSVPDSADSTKPANAALAIEICDDGRGIAPGARPGVGLRSMRERAEELGGTCVVEARRDRGTRVTVCLPAQAREQWNG